MMSLPQPREAPEHHPVLCGSVAFAIKPLISRRNSSASWPGFVLLLFAWVNTMHQCLKVV